MKKLFRVLTAAAVVTAAALPLSSAEAFWGGGPWGGYGWGGWGGWANPIGHRYYPDWGGYRGPYVRYPWMLGWGWAPGWWAPWYGPVVTAPVVVLPAPVAEGGVPAAPAQEPEVPSAPEEK